MELNNLTVLLVDNNSIGFVGIENTIKNHFKDWAIHKTNNINTNDVLTIVYNIVIWNIDDESYCQLSALENFKMAMPNCKIIIVSMGVKKINVVKYFEIGINGYTNLACQQETLIAYIKNVLNGEYIISDDDMKSILNYSRLNFQNEMVIAQLTRKEAIVMNSLCRGFKVIEIAKKIDMSISFVYKTKFRIFKKLGVENVFDLVIYQRELLSKGNSK